MAGLAIKYKKSVIGYLELVDDVWIFKYSDTFINQSRIKPLTDFPFVDKQYKSNDLFPFFECRIPGVGQPKIQDIIKKEGINPNNKFEMLKRFGYKTISNSFLLEYLDVIP